MKLKKISSSDVVPLPEKNTHKIKLKRFDMGSGRIKIKNLQGLTLTTLAKP